MLIGAVGLCLGFLVGGLALIAALGFVLQRSVDADAERTARDVAALVNAGALPQPVPVAGLDLVQVVDGEGRVRSASTDADRLVPMLTPDELARARGGEKLFLHGERFGVTGPLRVVALPAGPVADPQTVVVARPMSDVLKGVGLLRTILLVVFPLLVALLAAVAWRVIGATLRPVEALRAGAEEITGRTGRAGRLPVPAGDDEIHRLAVTLNGMLDRLESGRARQREFVADAAHELRSPLTNMRTQLEVAQRLAPTASWSAQEWSALMDDLLVDTTRLGRLVDDLLLLARSDETAGVARAEPVELGALVGEVGSRFPAVEVRVSQEPLWTVGEADALGRVVANLLDNAVRHARSTVSVTACADAGSPVVTVTDDGPGIAPEDRGRAFERFVRLDDARDRHGGGAGLGLAIVAELVRRHGGTVALSDAAPGLRVDIHLPPCPSLLPLI
jgi:signal transduction histidine kinase